MLTVVCVFTNYRFSYASDSKPETKKENKSNIEVGIFYGTLASTDQASRFIFVEPIDSRLPRTIFYVDVLTSYVVGGYRAKLSELKLDDKLAVRYLRYGDLKVAEEVFVVEGEFDEDYYRRRGIERREKPEERKPSAVDH